MSAMRYRGYEAVVAFDDEVGLFHGEVASLRDVITFQASSAEQLQGAFAASVEDYLAYCRERGEAPERPLQP